ncbi:hypothetical protein ACPCIT_04525 [Pseudomonas siliginis]|uniref:hypothetical protein n=1 Tax=Pseudomonas siliginis TaxID=2842346 RepID=UPI003C2DE7FF
MTEMMIVVRGFIPARLRSSRKPGTRDLPGETGSQVLGLLRSPTGINPLATEDVIATEDPIAPEDPIATVPIEGEHPVLTEMMIVARGFIPARLRSSRKPGTRDFPGEIGSQVLGLLRSPAGINPLATEVPIATEDRIAPEDPIATVPIEGSTRF